jgi:hypothetical protein
LINDDADAKNDPGLGAFFSADQDILDAMAENPGNYVAIPPRPSHCRARSAVWLDRPTCAVIRKPAATRRP